jgi:proteasome lid subunit RPN8/RPN11
MKLNGTPLINLSPQVVNIERYLCGKYPDLEWCGILFYTEEGSITDPDNYTINVKYLYPMDVGTSGFTSIENYEEVLDAIDKYPELEDMRQGFIHSHNSMDTFFSGTDVNQLVDAIKDYDYFLSIITNNAAEYMARISFEYEVDAKIGVNKYKSEIKNEAAYYQCDVNVTYDAIDEFLMKRIKEIDSNKTVYTYKSHKTSMNGLNTSSTLKSYLDMSYNDDFVLRPDSIVPKEYLELYHKELTDINECGIDEIKELVEGSFNMIVKDTLNKKQLAQVNDLIYKWVGTCYNQFVTGKNKISFGKRNTTEVNDWLLKTLNKKDSAYVDDNDLLYALPDLIDLIDEYSFSVMFKAFSIIYKTCIDNYTLLSAEILNLVYCSLLAFMASKSQYDIQTIERSFNTSPLSKEIMDIYSLYIDGLSTNNGLHMPYNYYNYYY